MICIYMYMYYIHVDLQISIHDTQYMGISFFDALKVLKGTEVEAPRIIPPNHTPNHTPESYPRIIPHEFFCR